MSFRNRLTFFFVVIVVIPMVAYGLVLNRLIDESEAGKADVQVSQGARTAGAVYAALVDDAEDAAAVVGGDRRLATALVRANRRAAQRRLRALVAQERLAGAEVRYGDLRLRAGRPDGVAAVRRRLLGRGDREVGAVTASVASARQYVDEVRRLTRRDVAISARGGVRAATTPKFPRVAERDERTETLGLADVGTDERQRFAEVAGPAGVTVLVLGPREVKGDTADATRLLLLLVGFLALAFAFAFLVSRSLQSQIERLLHAVRRVGSGDFAVAVPTEGRDEFSALGSEFNAMAAQLAQRLAELQSERARLQDAIRRIGESLGSNLDREALLELTVQTAVDGIGAACGRATVREELDRPLRETARAGDLVPFAAAITEAEASALRADGMAEATVGDAFAIAQPLAGQKRGLGLISAARSGRPFTHAERELFGYLARQAAVSVENVDLHETVQRQAVTDQLTGLSNRRRFQDVLGDEIERFKRGGQDLGLIMLDIDDFKSVNDTYGHSQGDLVLREVAEVLRASSREIDTPSRLGGEEMAVALPQTDLEGAFQFAERVRRGIEALELPVLDAADGATMRVTASFGAASLSIMPQPDHDGLVGAVDQALYEAKRTGKNRTVRAHAAPSAA